MSHDKDDPTPKPAPSPADAGKRTVPLLPLRDVVVFPHMVVPLFVGRERSVAALEAALARGAAGGGDAMEEG